MKAREVIAGEIRWVNEFTTVNIDEWASDILTALSTAGFKVVPVEATAETAVRGINAYEAYAELYPEQIDSVTHFKRVYRAMVEAAE